MASPRCFDSGCSFAYSKPRSGEMFVVKVLPNNVKPRSGGMYRIISLVNQLYLSRFALPELFVSMTKNEVGLPAVALGLLLAGMVRIKVRLNVCYSRPAFGLTIDTDKSDIPRQRGTRQSLNSFLVFNATSLFNISTGLS